MDQPSQSASSRVRAGVAALLRDAQASDMRVLDESAAEHVRNALQILSAGWHAVSGPVGDAVVQYRYRDTIAVRERLAKALNALENRPGRRRGHGGRKDLAARTHCKNGHEFTPENTGRRSDGTRTCRACGREASKRWRIYS